MDNKAEEYFIIILERIRDTINQRIDFYRAKKDYSGRIEGLQEAIAFIDLYTEGITYD